MSDPRKSAHPIGRAAGALLATGAMLGAASAAGPAAPAADAPSFVLRQFNAAFTPGAVEFAGSGAAIIVSVE
ncbi:hypothetical protein ACFQFC_11265 [Amorphoplanes digitatis]|uniref:Uncharacterized protein n=1 Tax=Actinoplanes digitatis TaxID=1868 RepID=A0A7W7I1Z2_9ACTN|nr:hypothetical protein [Actinoplanes digitatis]MBB4764778.1 hypothetical protein [Actinoplanes digitatis]GID91269.1 hypothetical protein Adi01nite_06810 [Actinoplanes digitatis]